ncbi:hypothetical protein ACFXAQ_15315, partial [Streptomyces olivaceus]|uniref:nSTAND1 domain-containing NTPase n=1 Tax=Streptomyces olivaceus TaxID=47716 RepID=UPI0036CD5B99
MEAGRIDRSQIGDHNVQISYQIGAGTFADRPGAPPLISISGDIDSPYRGLRAFEEVDAPFFFGRDQDSEHVLRLLAWRLESPSLLMVSGASGAGKSSLIRAGVLPRLRAQGLTGLPSARTWPCQLLTPSPQPMEELAVRVATLAGTDAATCRRSLAEDPAALSMMARQAALAHTATAPDHDRTAPPPRLLLVVDQFEQLFTRCRDEAQRQAFIAALHAAATRPAGAAGTAAAVVVLVVRSDFEARATDYPQLVDAVRERHLLAPMSELELRTAITEPARRAHAEVHTALVDTLMEKISPRTPDTAQDSKDARDPAARGAGLLPLLSHALDNAWRRRGDDTLLTLNDYTVTGGLETAVADSAQHAYDLLTPTQQTTARHVFLHLTATDENGTNTSAPTTRNDLLTATGPARAEHVPAVLEAFAGQRLLTLAPDSVEISHEALLTAWPLLRDTWLADTHTDHILRTRLRAATGQWQRNNRDPAYLYRGSLLQAAGETAARIADDPHHHPALTHTEAAFLHASTRARTRATRLRQSLIAALMALVVGLAAVTVFALRTSEEASRQRDVAVARQLVAQSAELRDSQPDISKLKALAAWRIHASDETRSALKEAAASPGIGFLTGHEGGGSLVAFSRNGTLATGDGNGIVRLWNIDTRKQIGAPLNTHGAVFSLAFNGDGTTLATGSFGDGSDGARLQLWNTRTHQQIGAPINAPGLITSMAFSSDGTILATGSSPNGVQLWDTQTRQQIGAPLNTHGEVSSVAFSNDGTTLASGSWDYSGTLESGVRLWDTRTHKQIGSFMKDPSGRVSSVAFSRDGTTLASGNTDFEGGDGVVRLWNTQTRKQIGAPLTGHHGSVFSVAFSSDGTTLASASGDGVGGSVGGSVLLWNTHTRQQMGAPLTSYDTFNSVAFSSDGTLASAGDGDADGHRVRLWNTHTHRQIGAPLTGLGEYPSLEFSNDGTTLASVSASGGIVRLWDAHTRQQIGAPMKDPSGRVSSVAFSNDGTTLASVSASGGIVRLWDTHTRQQIGAPMKDPSGRVSSVAFSSDGTILATGSGNALFTKGTVRLWDTRTHKQIGAPMKDPTASVSSVAFSSDGTILATGSGNALFTKGTVRLWD